MREITSIETVVLNGTCVQSRMNILHTINSSDDLDVTDPGRSISISTLMKNISSINRDNSMERLLDNNYR
jgi:hypothetical protein